MNTYSKPTPGTLARMKVAGMSAEAVAKADAFEAAEAQRTKETPSTAATAAHAPERDQ
ncbi:hypothetical protein [Serratia marcescens]|uniref:hypothetical protein n=1 Tax=Serratia marcescens TaxID=615 RepID=UPI000744E690|nr:hypothetical protein [Serratia marcescens]CVG43237.1 Uncharacterised protein [Serratia marcescens]